MNRKTNPVQLATYISVEQGANLKLLSERTRVTQADYVREALELLFERYASTLRVKPHGADTALTRKGAARKKAKRVK